MHTTEYFEQILEELSRAVPFILHEEAERMVNGILEAKKVFVAGAGRSGLMAKSFAMRMMHMGIDSYVIGETVTPNLESGDMLIIASGSGETKSLTPMVAKAKELGGLVSLVTINPESSIGKMADFSVKLPGSPKDQSEGNYHTIQPMASLFEQTLLLFFDSVILRFMEKKGMDNNTMFGRHANLE
ncbi:6-phospho-3-hexuloisomerase [Peribacillus sp. SCS-155]|uniref:6-phospho-3-hexuloisomerase n=1 Tax=Peribacillus sedimenti TaxID=3115297 RepID=UPI003906912A